MSNSNQSYEFLIYSTYGSLKELNSIKKEQKLRPLTIEEYKEEYDYPPAPFVYSHYMFSDLNYQPGTMAKLSYTPWVNFLIDINILKDKPFFICNGVIYGQCVTDKKSLLLQGKGNLKKIPSLQKLQTFINERLQKNKDKKKYNGYQDYTLSHEVLIDEIPLSYVFAILVSKKSEEYILKVQNMFPNIPVISLNINVPTYKKKLEKLFNKIKH